MNDMDTTKEEILQKHLNEIPHFSKSPDMYTRFLIYNAMDEFAKCYHEQKLNIHSVMQGLPNCPKCGKIDWIYSTKNEYLKCLTCWEAARSVGKAGWDASVSDGK